MPPRKKTTRKPKKAARSKKAAPKKSAAPKAAPAPKPAPKPAPVEAGVKRHVEGRGNPCLVCGQRTAYHEYSITGVGGYCSDECYNRRSE